MSTIQTPVPKDPTNVADQFATYVEIISLLRQHCPWDKKQTKETLSPLLLEETYETLEAIERNSYDELRKELGDVLLHIVMQAEIASEEQHFSMVDIIASSAEKLIHRHPHVFGDVVKTTEEEVMGQWEQLKLKEGKKSVLDGVPKSLPSLLRAHRIQEKAASVGFDFSSISDVWAKVLEEIKELEAEIQSENTELIEKELGDVLFSLVNIARRKNIHLEAVVQRANDKFIRRFQTIEVIAKELNSSIESLTLEEMDRLWEKAKLQEK